MPDSSEMHDRTAAQPPPAETEGRLEPWSHPWHDRLGLLYHRAIAEKIRCQPAIVEIARENLHRWQAAEPGMTPSQARLEWRRILDSGDIEQILRTMTDPSEEGHRRRQSTPFAGILSPEERQAIRNSIL